VNSLEAILEPLNVAASSSNRHVDWRESNTWRLRMRMTRLEAGCCRLAGGIFSDVRIVYRE
jgi:hypothetical protein